MDLASLQIEIDSRKAQQAKKDLEGLTSAAEKTEAATDSLSQANQESENRYQAIARAALERQAALNAEVRAQMEAGGETRKVTAAMREQAQEYTRVASAEHQARLANERQAAAMKAAAEAAEQNSLSLQKLMGQIDPLEGKLNRLDDMEMQLNHAFRQGAVDLETYGIALAKISGQRQQISDQQLKQVAAGADQAAASMGTLGLNTAQAQRDLITLGRAASRGDMAQASSSMIQLGRSSGVMASMFSLAGVSVLGLAGGVTALVAAYYQGRQESEAYNRELILTGNAAGVTAGQIAGMADRISDSVGTTAKAAQALALVAGSGKIAGDNMERIAHAAVSMSEATGRSIQEIIREFESLGRDPVRAITDLNDQYHFLTAAVYEQITALVEQGREQEATSLAERTYAAEMQSRARQIQSSLGTLETAWNAVARAASGAWDSMLDIGRPASTAQLQARADQVQAQLNQLLLSPGGFASTPGGAAVGDGGRARNAQIRGLREELAGLHAALSQSAGDDFTAASRSWWQEAQDKAIAAQTTINKLLEDGASNAEKERKAVEALYVQFDEIRKVNPDSELLKPVNMAAAEAAVRNQFAERERGTSPTRTRIDEGQRLLNQMNERLGLIGKETEYERTLFQVQSGRYQGLADWQKEAALDLAQHLDVMEEARREADQFERLMDSLYPEKAAGDEFIRQMHSLIQAFDDGVLSADQYAEAVARLEAQHDKSMSKVSQFTIQAARNIESHLGDGLFNILKGNFDNIGQAFSDMILRMAAEAAAANLAEALFGDYGSGKLGGVIGNAIGGFFGGGGTSAIDTSYAPDVSSFYADGGYTGPGGKYEPAGIVHKGEYVFSKEATQRIGVRRLEQMHKGYASGGYVGSSPAIGSPAAPNVAISLINKGGEQMQASQQGAPRFDGQKWVIDIVLDRMRRDRNFRREMQNAVAE